MNVPTNLVETSGDSTLIPPAPRGIRWKPDRAHTRWRYAILIPHLAVGIGLSLYLVLVWIWFTFGTNVQGVIIAAETYGKGNLNHRLRYSYCVGGTPYEGTEVVDFTVYEQFHNDSIESSDNSRPSIELRYFVLGPIHYSGFPRSYAIDTSLAEVTAGLDAFVVCFIFGMWFSVKRIQWLLKNGQVSCGTLESKRIWLGRHYATYRFISSVTGKEVRRRGVLFELEMWNKLDEQKPFHIFFDPKNPRFHTIYELSDFDVIPPRPDATLPPSQTPRPI